MGITRACSNHVVVAFWLFFHQIMASLSIALVPLEDREDTYSILRAFESSGTLVVVQKNVAGNVISVRDLCISM